MQNRSKSFVSLFLLLIFTGALSGWARSTASDFLIAAQIQHPQLNQPALLELTVTDARPKSGVCPYYLKKLDYSKSPAVLSLEIFEEVCVNEAFGPSSGVFYWPVPQSILAAKKTLQLNINGKAAGRLEYDLKNNIFIVHAK